VKFPEDYLRTEETALLLELEKNGVRMFYHPDLKVGHHRRKDLISLIHPTFYGGYYRAKVLKEKMAIDSGLFWLPALFVLMHLLVFISPAIFWTLTRIYLGLIVMMSLNLASRRKKMVLFPYITILHYFIVFFYGLGFLSNRLGLRENR
jgi:GT2 family glycosyltransferase